MITAYIVGLFITFIVLCWLDIEFSDSNDYMGIYGCLMMSVLWPFALLGALVFIVNTWNKKPV